MDWWGIYNQSNIKDFIISRLGCENIVKNGGKNSITLIL
jgi:hypothetical protein